MQHEPVIGRMPLELMRELELQKLKMMSDIHTVQMLMAGQAQAAIAWLQTPGESKALRIRQALARDGESPITFETLIELL